MRNIHWNGLNPFSEAAFVVFVPMCHSFYVTFFLTEPVKNKPGRLTFARGNRDKVCQCVPTRAGIGTALERPQSGLNKGFLFFMFQCSYVFYIDFFRKIKINI